MTRYELVGPYTGFYIEASREEDGFRIKMGGKSYLVKLEKTDDPDVLVAEFGGKPLKVVLREATAQSVSLSIGGEKMLFQKPSSTVAAPTKAISAGRVSKDLLVAPMPGRVISVMVKKGELVKANDPIVTVESMKMESVIRSDRDSEIAEILVAEGGTVKRGQALVRFRTTEGLS